jgi:hypothetical protein
MRCKETRLRCLRTRWHSPNRRSQRSCGRLFHIQVHTWSQVASLILAMPRSVTALICWCADSVTVGTYCGLCHTHACVRCMWPPAVQMKACHSARSRQLLLCDRRALADMKRRATIGCPVSPDGPVYPVDRTTTPAVKKLDMSKLPRFPDNIRTNPPSAMAQAVRITTVPPFQFCSEFALVRLPCCLEPSAN